MTGAQIKAAADALYQALRERAPIEPLTQTYPDIDLPQAYAISQALLERRLGDGERLVGKKIGVTSRAVQDLLDVHQPDFGLLTDVMEVDGVVDLSGGLIQPRAEGEIAFRLGADLMGPGITPEQVLAATERVYPCFEIVDSRVRDWKIRIQDTVADNASSGVFVLGRGVSPRDLDLSNCTMNVSKNGQPLSEGRGITSLTGSPALGSPENCIAWLANTLSAFGVRLKAGEIILSGSLVPLEPVGRGDHMALTIEGMGGVQVRFR